MDDYYESMSVKFINVVILGYLILCASSCSYLRDYSEDYLQADYYRKGQWSDAWRRISRDYLGADDYYKGQWKDSWKAYKASYLNANEYHQDSWRDAMKRLQYDYLKGY